MNAAERFRDFQRGQSGFPECEWPASIPSTERIGPGNSAWRYRSDPQMARTYLLCQHWRMSLVPSAHQSPSESWSAPSQISSTVVELAIHRRPVDVCYDHEDVFDPIFQVMDAGITLAGENPRGDVSDGFVKVSGHLVPGSLSVSSEVLRGPGEHNVKYLTYSTKIDGNEVSILPDTPLVQHQYTIQRSNLLHNDGHAGPISMLLSNASLCSLHTSGTILALQTQRTGQRQDLTADRWMTILGMLKGPQIPK